MQRQQVDSKIRVEIPPNRMDVIGVVLNVVVFDQERRPLNPIVMRLTLFEPTGPGQENTSQASRADSVQSRCRDIRCVPRGIFTQKSHQYVLLLLTQLAGLKSGGLERLDPSQIGGQNVRWRAFANYRLSALFVIERLDQQPRQVLFGSKRSQTFACALQDFSGIRAEESGRRRDGFAFRTIAAGALFS